MFVNKNIFWGGGGEGGRPLKFCSLVSWKQDMCIIPATLWPVPLEHTRCDQKVPRLSEWKLQLQLQFNAYCSKLFVNFGKNYVSSTLPTTPDLLDSIAPPDNCMHIYTGVCQMYSLASLSRWQACGSAVEDILYWQA